MKNKKDIYQGFEQGPIRPPSESQSLLIRFTRNCPWNKCLFCPVYKGEKFSLRSVENIIKDIDITCNYLNKIIENTENNKQIDQNLINKIFNDSKNKDRTAFNAALNWYFTGMESIFIQDANSLIMKPDNLIYVLKHMKKCFPMAKRITSYARSHTIARIKPDIMKDIADAGLNRIHIGLESGSDKVLDLIKKGCTQEMHINAGLKVKNAGIELSEYIMPGLGGIDLSKDHALETAKALNKINPDFIRIRTLAISPRTLLFEEYEQGRFKKSSDFMMVKELKLLVENLNNITSYIKSDHILNLLEDVQGKMPEHKEKILRVITDFLEMEPEKRVYYQVGKRMGVFRKTQDLSDITLLKKVKETCKLYNITSNNIDSIIQELMGRFV
ncbi:MAG: coproporphyrinogen III oxidase [Desulfobacteraceae bacterium 4572_130]|nr:MAG: coproporphyrinogen III oxidase [Desulfobacteraceae bacterium 4572_130]